MTANGSKGSLDKGGGGGVNICVDIITSLL